MKIGLFSDLHLDFYPPDTQHKIQNQLLVEAAGVDVLINGGDTHHHRQSRDCFNDAMASACPKYIDVPGNHDYYGEVFTDIVSRFMPAGSAESFMHGTMWTDFRRRDPIVTATAVRAISDFKAILRPMVKGVETPSLPELMIKSHDRFIRDLLEYAPTIVVSHFAPALGSIHPRFAGEILNGYFVNNDEEHILAAKPKYWFHGHCHDPADYMVGETRVISNPLGYPGETYRHIEDYHMRIIEV